MKAMLRSALAAAGHASLGMTVNRNASLLSRLVTKGEQPMLFGHRGPGLSNAQVQRMARKKRNQARNRRAHRG